MQHTGIQKVSKNFYFSQLSQKACHMTYPINSTEPPIVKTSVVFSFVGDNNSKPQNSARTKDLFQFLTSNLQITTSTVANHNLCEFVACNTWKTMTIMKLAKTISMDSEVKHAGSDGSMKEMVGRNATRRQAFSPLREWLYIWWQITVFNQTAHDFRHDYVIKTIIRPVQWLFPIFNALHSKGLPWKILLLLTILPRKIWLLDSPPPPPPLPHSTVLFPLTNKCC